MITWRWWTQHPFVRVSVVRPGKILDLTTWEWVAIEPNGEPRATQLAEPGRFTPFGPFLAIRIFAAPIPPGSMNDGGLVYFYCDSLGRAPQPQQYLDVAYAEQTV